MTVACFQGLWQTSNSIFVSGSNAAALLLRLPRHALPTTRILANAGERSPPCPAAHEPSHGVRGMVRLSVLCIYLCMGAYICVSHAPNLPMGKPLSPTISFWNTISQPGKFTTPSNDTQMGLLIGQLVKVLGSIIWFFPSKFGETSSAFWPSTQWLMATG